MTAIYARQSIDKKDSISIDTQIEFCRRFSDGQECRVYSDKGFSGKNIDRPEFQRLLSDIKLQSAIIKEVRKHKKVFLADRSISALEQLF